MGELIGSGVPLYIGHRLLDLLLVTAYNDYVGSKSREGVCGDFADSGSGTGYEGDLSRQMLHCNPPHDPSSSRLEHRAVGPGCPAVFSILVLIQARCFLAL